jgi:hypothetical protein
LAVPRQKQVLLTSRHRTAGVPNNSFYLLDCAIRCHNRPGEYITMTPTFFSMMKGWDVVSSSNRAFYLVIDDVHHECKMKIGSGYSSSSFATMLQGVLRLKSPGFSVSYDRISNRFRFVPPDDKSYYLRFGHRHQTSFFGFQSDTKSTRVFTKTQPLTSPHNVSMSPQVSVVIRSSLPTGEVFDNFQKEHPINTGVILVVPIDCPPYGELQYQAATPDSNTMKLLTNHVHSIQLLITDEIGDPLDCSDFVLGLRFDIFNPYTPV